MLLLATAYAPPIEYMAYIYATQGDSILVEAHEHIVKQSWRNRCDILTSMGVQSLTIPVERPNGGKTLIKDVLISNHGNWRHVHTQALRSSYGSSPYFEYYWDEILPFYERTYRYLWDYNTDLLFKLSSLLDLELQINETDDFIPINVSVDWYTDTRYRMHPRLGDRLIVDQLPEYYQPFKARLGFVPNLSIYDLLMNMGPESLLYLHRIAKHICIK